MRQLTKIKTKFAVVALVAILSTMIVPPKPVEALFGLGDIVYDPANYAVNLAASIAAGTSAVANVAFLASFGTAIESIPQGVANGAAMAACNGPAAVEKAAGFMNSISGGFSIISGGAFEAGKLAVIAGALRAASICLAGVEGALTAQLAGTVTYRMQFNAQQQLVQVKAQKEVVQARLNEVQQWQNSSVKDVLKALMIRLVLQLSKQYTTKYVTELVSRYRIPDVFKYANVLGTQVYAMSYITKNYSGDAEQQMILRSLMQSKFLNQPGRVSTARTLIQARAERNLGFDPLSLAFSDNGYESKMAQVGNVANNWPVLELVKNDQAEQAQAAGMSAAKDEIGTSNGFLSARSNGTTSCAAAVKQQAAIDQQTAGAETEFDSARQVYYSLKNANASEAELTKASQAWDQARAKVNSLPATVEKPIVDICNVIDSPANFVANSTQNLLKSYLEQNTNLKSEHLPLFLTQLTDMFGNFLTNILPGGKGKGASTLLDEGLGLAQRGVGEVVGNLKNPTPVNVPATVNKGDMIGFNITPGQVSPGQTFVISVDLTGLTPQDGPFAIDITSGSGTADLPRDTVTNPERVEYEAVAPTFTNAGTGTVVLTYNIIVRGAGFTRAQQLEVELVRPTVAGAYTATPNTFLVRGPQPELKIR